ncbi:hypothetical protein CNMCM5793_006124 [Aspergillus hiratsukae]|uniref:Uncharacterized protein n=1 Tax=Aspergillus hiratsukae TaxID=1194566 RepID=A0A8H6QI82_9EURO|nr:hypothetical protein CNMCM5793_006124 [Aspergillus hiratsukae]KAF7173178.1 hypothetical protein CNMCM6106_007316 [Aspergillus hiratsukae]
MWMAEMQSNPSGLGFTPCSSSSFTISSLPFSAAWKSGKHGTLGSIEESTSPSRNKRFASWRSFGGPEQSRRVMNPDVVTKQSRVEEGVRASIRLLKSVQVSLGQELGDEKDDLSGEV